MAPRLYDAHNHLQDDRLKPALPAVIEVLRAQPIGLMVVNGSCEEDWPMVLNLARELPFVLPSFGYHPWYIKDRTSNWLPRLTEYLSLIPSAVGEVGLDRWVENYDFADQQAVFVAQLRLAADRNLPLSIHCLQAWGALFDLLRNHPRPACGFLLHSFGGPREMVQPLADLGAYFSVPGYFAHERKARQRETFQHVPLDRLLIETDAPDQSLPAHRIKFPLATPTGQPINHPANLESVYAFAAELLGLAPDVLAQQVERNFLKLFAKVLPQPIP